MDIKQVIVGLKNLGLAYLENNCNFGDKSKQLRKEGKMLRNAILRVKVKQKKSSDIKSQIRFDEIDHRLACGWCSDPQDSAQNKRYLKQYCAEFNLH